MKINNCNQNTQSNKSNVSFRSGMTPAILRQMQQADTVEISKRLAQKNIASDFKGNKIIVWCNEKTVQIFKTLNKKYHAEFSLPPVIEVEDFINVKGNSALRSPGLCLFSKGKPLNNSQKMYPENSILFNSFDTIREELPKDQSWMFDWKYINAIADDQYSNKETSTSHFLDIFLHEFSHAAHKENLEKFFPQDILAYKYFSIINDADYHNFYKSLYGETVSQICSYAETTPLEAVACHLSKVIAENLDENLNLVKNPLKNSPYEKTSAIKEFFSRHKETKENLDYLVKEFWNGKFEPNYKNLK